MRPALKAPSGCAVPTTRAGTMQHRLLSCDFNQQQVPPERSSATPGSKPGLGLSYHKLFPLLSGRLCHVAAVGRAMRVMQHAALVQTMSTVDHLQQLQVTSTVRTTGLCPPKIQLRQPFRGACDCSVHSDVSSLARVLAPPSLSTIPQPQCRLTFST